MGGSKRLLEEMQAGQQWGIDICVATGALEECEYHPGTYYDGGEDVAEALKEASDDDEREQIQSAYDDNSGVDYCTSCDRNDRD